MPDPPPNGSGSPHRIVFTPSGLGGTVQRGTTVLDAARSLGVDLDSVCGGRGICGRCQVSPGFGEFSKWSITSTDAAITAPGAIEAAYRGRRPLDAGNRLGCAARIEGDLVVDVPAASQLHRQVVRKEVDLDEVDLDPMTTLHYLELAPEGASPTVGTALSTTERVCRALADQWGLATDSVDPAAIGPLQAAAGTATCTVARRDGRIVAAWPGFVDQVFGLAVDVGSTTVAGHLCDLLSGEVVASAGAMNPQIRFGEDLMSRVSYAMLNEGGGRAMTAAIRSAIDELLGQLLAATIGREAIPADRVLDVVLVGNPIMHHLVLGFDPTPLGQAPFPLATDRPVDTTAERLQLNAPLAAVHAGPCIAGHVGADTVAAILAERPHRSEDVQLLVDVGTNAEIVLGNRHHLLAASSPTGPAFEGAQISSGQRATVGAIERVRIDRHTLEPRFKVIGSERWSDDPDLDPGADRVVLHPTGICGSGIIEVISELFLAGVVDAQGVISPEAATRTARVEPDERTFAYRLTETIQITQADVRAVQLAKAALRAGIDLLLERAEWDAVDEIRLAGAFGAHIDPIHAMVIGLIPDGSPDRVCSVGNAAGAGAVRALLSRRCREELDEIARSVTKVETATEPRFQELFVAALAFPHATAPAPNLAATVDLPSPRPDEPVRGSSRRRRRRRRQNTTAPTPAPTPTSTDEEAK